LVRVSTEDLDEALRASPAPLSTMGRGLDADRAYFLACAAAGRHAAALLCSGTMTSLPDLLRSHPREDEPMGLPVKLRHLPQRIVTGAFILQSGVAKWNADEETAKQLHGFASGTYPFLAKLKPEDFVKLLAGTEIALGTALLLPFVPTVVAGAGLTAFSGGLLGLYARTPGMRREGTPLPTQQGTALAKDVWMAGIGIGLVLDELTDSD
jgi:uncharacterized membrane protein YphA (DoxX/SURF4 family)